MQNVCPGTHMICTANEGRRPVPSTRAVRVAACAESIVRVGRGKGARSSSTQPAPLDGSSGLIRACCLNTCLLLACFVCLAFLPACLLAFGIRSNTVHTHDGAILLRCVRHATPGQGISILDSVVQIPLSTNSNTLLSVETNGKARVSLLGRILHGIP
jgi:hypothetical protein